MKYIEVKSMDTQNTDDESIDSDMSLSYLMHLQQRKLTLKLAAMKEIENYREEKVQFHQYIHMKWVETYDDIDRIFYGKHLIK